MYLLWAVIPLAAWATRPIFRVPTIVFSSVVSVILMPNGGEYQPFIIVQAAIATVVVAGLLIIATRNLLPWRGEDHVPARPTESVDAYAGNP